MEARVQSVDLGGGEPHIVLNPPASVQARSWGDNHPAITYTAEIMIQRLAITERRPTPRDLGSRSTSRARV